MTEKAHEPQGKSTKRGGRSSAPARADRRGGGPQPVKPGVGGSVGAARWALQLQRQVGNQAVGRLLGAEKPRGSDRLTTVDDRGRPDRGNRNQLQRLLEAQQGRGHGLSDDTRQDLEAGIGAPLEDVRVHTDEAAASMATQLGARAFTVGQDIYFGQGEYDPASSTGYGLLAHEVTHTRQQPPLGGAAASSGSLTVEAATAPAEQQAEQVAERLSARRQPAEPGTIAPAAAVRPDPAAGAGLIQRQAIPGNNQSMLEEPPPEVNQSFMEEPAASTSPTEPAAEGAVRPGEEEKLEQIRDLAYQWWVGPFDEAKIENLWESFGDRLPRVAADHELLWLHCLDVGAELDDLPQVTKLKDQFEEDIKQIVSDYLVHNRQVVLDELQPLGLPFTESTPVPAPTELQAEQTRQLQAAAAALAKLQTAQAQARRTYVGYELILETPYSMTETTMSLPRWSPVTFDPYAPKPSTTAPDFVLLTPIREQIVPYEQVKEKYDQASDAITDLLLRYPALFAFTREGSTATAAAVTAGFAVTQSPQQAREQLATALHQVLHDILGAQDKLSSGDLNPLDLTPIHEQLFAGKRGKSGVDWSEWFPRWAATDAVGDHQFHQALIALGLQVAAAALFLLAPFTGGASLYLMLGGLAVTGAKFYLSQERYETLAQAAKTNVTPGTELVTPQQVEAAESIRNADAIALALAALVVGAAVGAKLIGAIRGPALLSPEQIGAMTDEEVLAEIGRQIPDPAQRSRLLQTVQRPRTLLKYLGRGTTPAELEAAAAQVAKQGVPQGLTDEQFAQLSSDVRAAGQRYGTDIRVQGSRAAGVAKPGGDLDIAIRVEETRFNEIIAERFKTPRPGTSPERYMLNAKSSGMIHSGKLGLTDVGERLSAQFGFEKVDISVVRIGGPADVGPWVPLK